VGWLGVVSVIDEAIWPGRFYNGSETLSEGVGARRFRLSLLFGDERPHGSCKTQ